jgi:hypothetical protein
MTAAEWLAALRRRWRVLAVLLLCTLVAVVIVHKRPIAYQACASVSTTAPPTKVSPNSYSITQSSLVTTAGIVTTQLSSGQTQQTLRAQGLTAGYTAQVHNTGPSETPEYSEPLADLCTSSYDASMSMRTDQALVAQFAVLLRDLQVSTSVPPRSFETMTVIAPPGVVAVTGRPSQAYLGVGIFGAAVAVAFTIWYDLYRRKRERLQPAMPARRRLAAGRLGSVFNRRLLSSRSQVE